MMHLKNECRATFNLFSAMHLISSPAVEFEHSSFSNISISCMEDKSVTAGDIVAM